MKKMQKIKILQNRETGKWHIVRKKKYLAAPFATRQEAEAHLRSMFGVVMMVRG